MNKTTELAIKACVRDVVNFPKEGIVFKDITPIFQNPTINKKVLDCLVEQLEVLKPDVIVGVDSRGFLFGNAIALQLGVPFVMARKKGKLPYDKITQRYNLEYGTDELEIHKDAIAKNQKVVIHDDLLATGGTAECAAKLVERLEGDLIGFSFIINLKFLEGDSFLKQYSSNIFSVIAYD